MIQNVEREVENISGIISKLYKSIENSFIKYAPKPLFDKSFQLYGKYKEQPDAAAFYEIAASKFASAKAKEYIKQNGKIFEKVSDINNRNLELFVRSKLLKQIGTIETKGVIYDSNSSVSQAITKEQSFRTLIANKKTELINNRKIDNTSLSFEQGNLKNAYHYADIINIQLDYNDNLCALIVDTYDFNKFEDNPIVQKGGKYQNEGKLEPYYNIAIIKVPKEHWINY